MVAQDKNRTGAGAARTAASASLAAAKIVSTVTESSAASSTKPPLPPAAACALASDNFNAAFSRANAASCPSSLVTLVSAPDQPNVSDQTGQNVNEEGRRAENRTPRSELLLEFLNHIIALV